MTESPVVRHVIDAISPASEPDATAARQLVAPAGTPILERLAATLGGAQHTPRPRVARRTLVVVAADHPARDSSSVPGGATATTALAQAIADGTAAVAQIARTTKTPILLVDAGVRDPSAMPPSAVRLGPSSTAMTVADAVLGLEAGVALAISLADPGADVLAVGSLGQGAGMVAMAALDARASDPGTGGIELLARIGGPDTAVLAGLMLCAASMRIPVVLDSGATGAAAMIAARLAPSVTDYLIAPHIGTLGHAQLLRVLGITPMFELALGHGDGTGASIALPLLDQVAAMAACV